MNKLKETPLCKHRYQHECIGLVMCPLWEQELCDAADTECKDYVPDKDNY